MGRLGQKTKRGWYDYSGGRTPVNDPEVEAMIVAHSAKLGRARRVLEPCEIVDRALLSMANEGFKIVEEGIAQRESDVDIVYIYGYGYPRRQGGPLYWARHGREGGLAKMVEDLRKYAAAHPDVPHWKPSALLLREAGFDDAPAAKL
jgi:3-hydroxyacyl-CoA dehydrogenase